MNPILRLACGAFASLAACHAQAVTVFDSFGPFPNATFGGSGIPNDSVAKSMQIVDGLTTITLAMNATQRFFNPPLTNDGAGTFFATPGSNFGGPGNPSATEGALWNFNFYIDVAGGGKTITDYDITLFYDFDPAPGNSFASLGRIDIDASVPTGTTLFQGSQNLLFAFLASDAPPFVDAPGGSFNPNIAGNYQFGISVTDGSFPLETLAIEVQVVPVPAAVWLLGSALLGSGAVARRRRA
jgi:hypothetical protein